MSEAILQMRQITKSFSANKVLRGIDLEAYLSLIHIWQRR